VQVAKNGLLPDLDCHRAGPGRQQRRSTRRRVNNDTSTYSAGIDLDLPIDRVAERNQYRSSLIRWSAARASYDQLRDQIAADARDRLRLIRSAQISLDIQRKGSSWRSCVWTTPTSVCGRAAATTATSSMPRTTSCGPRKPSRRRASLQIQVLQFLRIRAPAGRSRRRGHRARLGPTIRRSEGVNEPKRRQ
jgi:hypothetical protein